MNEQTLVQRLRHTCKFPASPKHHDIPLMREATDLIESQAKRIEELEKVVERQEDELSWLFEVVTKVRKTSLAWTKHKNLQHAPGHIRNIIYWTEEPCRFAEEAAQAKTAKGVGAKRVAGLSTLPADSEMFSPGDR